MRPQQVCKEIGIQGPSGKLLSSPGSVYRNALRRDSLSQDPQWKIQRYCACHGHFSFTGGIRSVAFAAATAIAFSVFPFGTGTEDES